MKLHQYKNYDEYKSIQIEGNIKKINCSSTHRDNLSKICQLFISKLKPKFGLCHGTRRGIEQQTFINNLHCEVLGTEISPTAIQFPNTIEWDFHEVKDEWIGNCDFVYSNAWDHAMEPVKAIGNWIKCLNENGICILEYNPGHMHSSHALDPFKGTLDEFELFLKSISVECKFTILTIYKIQDYTYFILRRVI